MNKQIPISIIVGMAKNGVIGRGNALPWKISEDLKRFKQITLGHPVIMGRKTFESIGRPLPGRTNIVITRSCGQAPAGIILVGSLEEAIKEAKRENPSEIFIIGGSQIYEMALTQSLVDKLYITFVDLDVVGDAYFPAHFLKSFREIASEEFLSEATKTSGRFTVWKKQD